MAGAATPAPAAKLIAVSARFLAAVHAPSTANAQARVDNARMVPFRRCRSRNALISLSQLDFRRGAPFDGVGDGMAVFLQQLINGLTLGSIYGLIAIGYTMVYGIIGMINFAHGDVFMVGGLHRADRRFSSWRAARRHLRAARAARRAGRRDGADRAVGLDDRARRLPAAARLVPAGAADLRHRHVDLPAELRAGRSRARASSRCRR